MVSTVTTTSKTTLWKTDPAHTLVEFSAKHMMVTTVKGQFKKAEAEVNWDEANFTNSSVEATIDTSSLVSGEDRRDTHLRSADFFDVASHPDFTVAVDGVTPAEDGVRVAGSITIAGQTRPLSFDARVSMADGEVWLDAEVPYNRADFGMTWNMYARAAVG